MTVSPHRPSLIGHTLGRFVLMARLGKGGSGEAFRAQQVQRGRSAVINVLRREVATAPNRVERCLREAKLVSRLIAQILQGSDCRVPLEVAGRRITALPMSCKSGASSRTLRR